MNYSAIQNLTGNSFNILYEFIYIITLYDILQKNKCTEYFFYQTCLMVMSSLFLKEWNYHYVYFIQIKYIFSFACSQFCS